MTVKIQDEAGQPINEAEALLITEHTRMKGHGLPGKWKQGQGGTITFSASDITTSPNQEKQPEHFNVIARAKGYAPTIFETDATPSGAGAPLEKNLTLQNGRKISLELVPPPGMELPADLQPQIVPKSFVGSSWTGRSLESEGKWVNIAPGKVGPDGKFEFSVADDTPPLYLIIDHPGFLRGWQADEPLATTGTSVRVELPKPTSIDVTFTNPYADDVPADAVPTLKVTTSRNIPGSSTWLVGVATYKNAPGEREWKLRDLPPDAYYLAASEGPVESRQSQGEKYVADTSRTVALSAHSVIPPVVALDENGTTIPDAEGRLLSSDKQAATYGWTEAKDGLIKFRRTDTTGRFAGDEVINDFIVEVRAPGFAPNNAQLKTGAPTLPPVPVTLKPGRKVLMTITSEDGRPVPTDLLPIVMSDDQFPGSLNYLWQPKNAPALALATHSEGNQWEFSIPEDTKSFRIGLRKDNFLGSYWSEEYFYTGQETIALELPIPGGLQADITLTSSPFASKDGADEEIYYYSLSRIVRNGSSSLQVSIDAANITDSTSSLTSNLPPGDYELSVQARGGQMNPPKVQVKIEPGTTATASITAIPRDPDADRFGRRSPKFPRMNITDGSGNAIPDAKIIVRKKSSKYLPTLKWEPAGTDGWIKPKPEPSEEDPDGEFEVLVRAPGFPLSVESITLPTSATELITELKPGKDIVLSLKAESGKIPDGLVPSVFPESWGKPVWLSTQESQVNNYAPETMLSPTAVKPMGDGKYALAIDAKSTEPLYVLVHHPDFLNCFQAGPFDPAQLATSGTLDIVLPKPATLNAFFDLTGETLDSPVVTMEVSRSQEVPGSGSWSLSIIKEEVPVTSASLVATDLAPGKYTVAAIAAGKTAYYQHDVFSTRKNATLDAEESETLSLKYRPFKKEWLEGPYTALVKVLNTKGEPAKGQKYRVTWYASGYPQQTIAEGVVPDNGLIKLENLAGVDKPAKQEDFADRGGVPSFTVSAGSVRLGDVSFYDYREGEFHPLADGKTTKEFEFRMPPNVGDVAPDIAMVDLVTSKIVNLKDFQGQVVLIDFWATWCGPCQGPMAENQEIMRKRGEDWKGKAVILAVSIDDEIETVRKHLNKNDWHQTRNTWAAPGVGDKDAVGWKSPAAITYGINSIPTMVLIDKDGIIKSRGHVSDIEAEIETLLR